MRRERDHAEAEHERLLDGYDEIRLKYNTLVDNYDRLKEMKPTQSHLELHSENKRQLDDIEGLRVDLGKKTQELEAAKRKNASLEDSALTKQYRSALEDISRREAECKYKVQLAQNRTDELQHMYDYQMAKYQKLVVNKTQATQTNLPLEHVAEEQAILLSQVS